jgi:chorismate mutase
MENAKKIAFQKMKNNISIFQPERWEEVIKTRVKEGLEKDLNEDFVSRLYQFIHEESIRMQEQVLTN